MNIVAFQGLRPIHPTAWQDMLSIPAVWLKIQAAQTILDEEHIGVEGYPLNLIDYSMGKIPPLSHHTLTVFEHPIIFLTSLALWEAEKPPCDGVIGFSMGEWTATVAAGCLGFREGFLTVIKRGMLTSQAGGSSLLLRGPLPIRRLRAFSAFTQDVWLANISSFSQGIISGESEKITAIQKELGEHHPQLKVSPIDIGGAFHTPAMRNARKELEAFLRNVKFRNPRVPLILNATGEPEENPSEIKRLLLRQMTARLYFPRTARKLPLTARVHEIVVPLGGRPTVSQFINDGKKRPRQLSSPKRVIAGQSA